MAWPFSRNLETKDNPVGGAIAFGLPMAKPSIINAKSFIREGYQQNVIVYRAIKEIVTAATSIEVNLYQGDTLVKSSPILDLMARPNPSQSYSAWLTEMLVNRLLQGETSLVIAGAGDKPTELWPVNPVNVSVKPGASGLPSEYVHEVNGKKTTFPVERVSGKSDLFFAKTYNPDNYWRGQSPLMAAGLAGDTHNAGAKWNYSLLKNSARPSGIVRFKGQYPGQETLQRMREYFKKSMQGEGNAGEIPMLADDAEWVDVSHSPRDMDFLNTMKEAAKQIASAYGVPLPLIDNDASTFNNLEQAKERLYTDTVIPLLKEFLDDFGAWLLPRYGKGYEFRLDLDTIPALEALRGRKFDRAIRAATANILTREEAREMIGFSEPPKGHFLNEGDAFDMGADDAKALAYGGFKVVGE